jgi:hypothetical protein
MSVRLILNEMCLIKMYTGRILKQILHKQLHYQITMFKKTNLKRMHTHHRKKYFSDVSHHRTVTPLNFH